MATKKTGTSGRTVAASKSGPTRQSATKKSGTKSAARRTTSKQSASADESTGSRRSSSSRTTAARASAPKRKSGVAIAAGAAQQLLDLTGRDVEGVTGLERADDGWRVEVEVVEVRRIPDTTDVLALYEVTLDDDGDLESYRRLRRYVRGTPGQES